MQSGDDGVSMGTPVVTKPPGSSTQAPGAQPSVGTPTTIAPVATPAPPASRTPSASPAAPPVSGSDNKGAPLIYVDHGMSDDTILLLCLSITVAVAFITLFFVVSSVRHMRERAARTQRGLPPSHLDKKALPALFIRSKDLKTPKGPVEGPYVTPPGRVPAIPNPMQAGGGAGATVAGGREEGAEDIEMTRAYINYNLTNADVTPQGNNVPRRGANPTTESSNYYAGGGGRGEHHALSPLSSTVSRKDSRQLASRDHQQREPLLQSYPGQQQPQGQQRSAPSSARDLQAARSARDLQKPLSGVGSRQVPRSISREGEWPAPAPQTVDSYRFEPPRPQAPPPPPPPPAYGWDAEPRGPQPPPDVSGYHVSQSRVLKATKTGILTPVTEASSLEPASLEPAAFDRNSDVFCVDDFDETESPQMMLRRTSSAPPRARESASRYRSDTPPGIAERPKDFYNEKAMALM